MSWCTHALNGISKLSSQLQSCRCSSRRGTRRRRSCHWSEESLHCVRRIANCRLGYPGVAFWHATQSAPPENHAPAALVAEELLHLSKWQPKCTVPFAKSFLPFSPCRLRHAEGTRRSPTATFPPHLFRLRLLDCVSSLCFEELEPHLWRSKERFDSSHFIIFSWQRIFLAACMVFCLHCWKATLSAVFVW